MIAPQQLEDLALRIANAWEHQGRTNGLALNGPGHLTAQLVRVLDELDELTRGDERRCYCDTGRRARERGEPGSHDMRCPAAKSTENASPRFFRGVP